jgi:hypothetical protein
MSMRPLSTGEGNNDVSDLKRISNRQHAVKQTYFDNIRSRDPHEGQETLFGYFRSCFPNEATETLSDVFHSFSAHDKNMAATNAAMEGDDEEKEAKDCHAKERAWIRRSMKKNRDPCANQLEEYGSFNFNSPEIDDRIYDANQYEVSDSESTN